MMTKFLIWGFWKEQQGWKEAWGWVCISTFHKLEKGSCASETIGWWRLRVVGWGLLTLSRTLFWWVINEATYSLKQTHIRPHGNVYLTTEKMKTWVLRLTNYFLHPGGEPADYKDLEMTCAHLPPEVKQGGDSPPLQPLGFLLLLLLLILTDF